MRPIGEPLAADQAEVRLMHQRGGAEGLSRPFPSEHLVSEFLKLIVDQRQELVDSGRLALLDPVQNPRQIGHGGNHTRCNWPQRPDQMARPYRMRIMGKTRGAQSAERKEPADRKVWIDHRLKELAEIFAISVGGYSVLDNNLHLLARLDLDTAKGRSDEEVVQRCGRLFPPRDKPRRPLFDSTHEGATLRERISP
jgi:hypothetical protein